MIGILGAFNNNNNNKLHNNNGIFKGLGIKNSKTKAIIKLINNNQKTFWIYEK